METAESSNKSQDFLKLLIQVSICMVLLSQNIVKAENVKSEYSHVDFTISLSITKIYGGLRKVVFDYYHKLCLEKYYFQISEHLHQISHCGITVYNIIWYKSGHFLKRTF